MSNIIDFKPRAVMPEPTADLGQLPDETAKVLEMVQQSAVMQLVSTLAFYANQGHDHGNKARAAMPALREILARGGIELVEQQPQ